jgi:hypothetical protein
MHNPTLTTMVCQTCGHYLLYFYEDPICPKCKNLAVLDSITAVSISGKIMDYFTKMFYQYIQQFNKHMLLGNLAAHREQISREYFREYSPLKLGKLFSITLIIKQIVALSETGNKPPNSSEVSKIIQMSEKLVEAEDEHLKIEACYSKMLYLKKFDEKRFDVEKEYGNFKILENEKYYSIMRGIFANHGLLSPEEADKKFRELEAEVEADSENQETKEYTVEDFISTNYDLISAIYAGLLRNSLHAKTFDVRNYIELFGEPSKLMEFVSSFCFRGENIQTVCPIRKFIVRAQQFFKVSREKIMQVLLFDENNHSIFPLFIRFKSEALGDVVFISHRFSYFIFTLLHVVMKKQLFDAETEKRSIEFERKIAREEFEKLGYNYIASVTDKRKVSLEIDGLAIKDERCYVIECKSWRLRPLLESSRWREQTIRDLKGIIEGKKYTFDENTKIKKITRKPSIIEKISFVKNNLDRWNLTNKVTQVIGLILLADFSPVSELDGIKILSINQIHLLH